jgi:hypothetical protein
VDQLAQDYASRQVVFLEHDVDQPPPARYGRWWAAFGGGSASLPLVMVDSGNRISSGWLSFYEVYKGLVDAELARPAQAQVQATWRRVGNQVRFSVQVTNLSGGALGTATDATVHAMVYEDARVHSTSRYVRAAVAQAIVSLASGATASFDLQTADLAGVDWNRLHYVAAVDYRPAGRSGAYDMLQAAVAQSGAPTPTGTITPTPTGTASPTPTGTASPTLTGTASSTPTGTASPTRTPTSTRTSMVTATATPFHASHWVYLPLVVRVR